MFNVVKSFHFENESKLMQSISESENFKQAQMSQAKSKNKNRFIICFQLQAMP